MSDRYYSLHRARVPHRLPEEEAVGALEDAFGDRLRDVAFDHDPTEGRVVIFSLWLDHRRQRLDVAADLADVEGITYLGRTTTDG